MVVEKENRGVEGSKQFTSNYTAVAEPLQTGFVTTKHFVQRSKDGNEADDGNTNYTYIQEFFCSILTKVDSLENCVVWYDLKDILTITDTSYFTYWPSSEIGLIQVLLIENYA